MNLNYYFSSRHVRKKHFSFQLLSVYFVVLGNLTDLLLTWFLMISGNPSSKCQRVWLLNRRTFDTSIKNLVFSCAGPGIFVRKTSILQCSGRGIQHFPGGPLANFYGTIELVIFQGDGDPDPLLSFGSAHASSLNLSSHTNVFLTTLHGCIKSARDQSHDIWRLELGKVKNTTFLVKRKFWF